MCLRRVPECPEREHTTESFGGGSRIVTPVGFDDTVLPSVAPSSHLDIVAALIPGLAMHRLVVVPHRLRKSTGP